MKEIELLDEMTIQGIKYVIVSYTLGQDSARIELKEARHFYNDRTLYNEALTN